MKYEIEKFEPCQDALTFRSQYKTFEQAWQNCPRGDWMLWIAKKAGVDLKILTLAKVRCAQTVIHLMKDERSLNALRVAEKFALTDEVAVEDLRHAAAAAYTAAYAAYAAYAADADAYAYAYAAYAAAYAADAAAAAYARIKNQQQTADICREILTDAVFKALQP